MKTQNILKISFLTLLFTSEVSCSTSLLNSERKRTKQLQKDDVHINSQQLESISGSRQINLTDSSSNLFKVTIFPVDTFTFSLEGGFNGKATKIEATGINWQLKKMRDSSELFFEKGTRVEYDNKRDVLKVESSKVKVIERKRVSWVLGLAVLVIISLLIWFWWKRR